MPEDQLLIEATGEVITAMTRDEAETITRKITSELDGIATHWENVMPLIGEAMTRQAWAALGYASPTAYTSDRFAGALTRLSIQVRRELVSELTEAGLSTRAIAPIIGKSNFTVHGDLEAGVRPPNTSPEPVADPAPAPQPEWTSATDALNTITDTTEHGLPKSDQIIGRDGKTYQRPTPAPAPAPKPKRKPLPDQTLHTAEDMTRAAERLADLFRDDRMPQNREQVDAFTRSHLNRTIEVCRNLIDQLDA